MNARHRMGFWFSSYALKYYWPIKLRHSLKCIIFRRKWLMKFIFGMQINIQVFYELMLSFWVCVARHTQSIQNKEIPYLCNIPKKNVKAEVDSFFKSILSI